MNKETIINAFKKIKATPKEKSLVRLQMCCEIFGALSLDLILLPINGWKLTYRALFNLNAIYCYNDVIMAQI